MTIDLKNPFLLLLLTAAVFGVGCDSADERRAQYALTEQGRLQIEDNIQFQDKLPQFDNHRFRLFKIKGRFFIGPREYGFYDGSTGFYWPSKHPINGPGDFPEQGNYHDDVVVDVFIRRLDPALYKAAQERFANAMSNEIESRTLLRAGLERIRFKDTPQGSFRGADAYVATENRTVGGELPIVGCQRRTQRLGAVGHFQWKGDLEVLLRFNSQFCADWPEIYAEVDKVLNTVRELQP